MSEIATGAENLSPELYLSLGREKLMSEDRAEWIEGVSYIAKAYKLGNPEAACLYANLILHGAIIIPGRDSEECALTIFCAEASRGNLKARSFLNSYCEKRYSENVDNEENPYFGPLKDFDGYIISVNRKGLLTPIDAVLEYKDGVNVFTLSTNVAFAVGDLPNPEKFAQAVLDGFMEWQGEYKVFGNQTVKVKVNLTTDGSIFDCVYVLPFTSNLADDVNKMSKYIGSKKGKEQLKSCIDDKRSFAVSGLKWSANSRKSIVIMSRNGKFDDYEEIKHVAKHEFGHALGLGDLYVSESDNLEGVDKGQYNELDGFYISDKYYNLVMCDHHGPISNNDIEMVILAFRENKIQLYQPKNFRGRISKALGKGN